ncbi:MAG: ribosome biogenesis factor YjgA [Rhodanobacteraceae bacterium]
MRNPDPAAEPAPPSRSQKRRDALDILKLAETLAGLSTSERDRLPLSDQLRAEVARAGAITQHIARKRQIQYLAKQLRNHIDTLEPIRLSLESSRKNARIEAAHMRRVESWRERLLLDGDDALVELAELRPAADCQRLRTLMRQAITEAQRGQPPRASRELFRLLRDLLQSP